MLDITPIMEAVFTLLAAVLGVIVVPFIKSRVDAFWIGVAVDAAEQIYQGSKRGEEKKAYVLEWLKKNNITVNQKRLDAMLEAIVGKLNKELKGEADKDGKDGDDDDASGCWTSAEHGQGGNWLH